VASTTDIVRIHYHRPPDREDVFEQQLISRLDDCIVTLLERTQLAEPMIVGGETVLENGSPVLWFTFPGEWHDIGLFHRADDGRFTGTYTNVLSPVRFSDSLTWEAEDLFVDVWVDARGELRVLDVDELDEAERSGWIASELADRARSEAAMIVERHGRGEWPPPLVRGWSLDRARAAAGA
jgi:predicted RNA-binding protein associated with RNAse of E/G family